LTHAADKAKAMTFAQWQARAKARRRQAVPELDPTRSICWRRAPAGPGFLMMQNFSGDHEIQPGEAYAMAIGHFAIAARRPPLRAALAAAGTGAVEGRTAGTTAASGPARFLRGTRTASSAARPGSVRSFQASIGRRGRIRLSDCWNGLRGR